VLDLHRRRQRIDRRGDDPGMRRGDDARGLGGRDRFEHRRQHLPGQPAPRTQIRRGPHPARRLGRADPNELRQQRRGVAEGVFMGQTPRVDLGDQRVIDGGQPPLLNLQIPQHRQHIVARQGGQVQVLQFVDQGAEPRHDRSRNVCLNDIEHAFNIPTGAAKRKHFRLIGKRIKRELIMKAGRGRQGQTNRQPATQPTDRALPPSPPLFKAAQREPRTCRGTTKSCAAKTAAIPGPATCTRRPHYLRDYLRGQQESRTPGPRYR
jgi:hypothetical protein